MRHLISVMAVCLLAGCEVPGAYDSATVPSAQPQAAAPTIQRRAAVPTIAVTRSNAQSSFRAVSRRVEPVAEQVCRETTRGVNCDFNISILPDPDAPPNAYQSLDRNGRPQITFTKKMLDEIQNTDELAFVMSHEAAHHVRGHLARQQRNALTAGILGAALGAGLGLDASATGALQDATLQVGARAYSKSYELEADQLGTLITYQSGYSPSLGVRFFDRLPDPGNQFLGTHPPNPERVRIVQQTIQQYGLN